MRWVYAAGVIAMMAEYFSSGDGAVLGLPNGAVRQFDLAFKPNTTAPLGVGLARPFPASVLAVFLLQPLDEGFDGLGHGRPLESAV